MSMKKGDKMTDKMKAHLSKIKKGSIAWNKGKMMSISMIEKMKGNTNGKGNKNRIFNPLTISRMSLSKLGKPSNAKGSKRTVEDRLKMSQIKRNQFLLKDPDYVFYEGGITGNGRRRLRRKRIVVNGGCHSNGEWETLKTQYNFTCPRCKKIEPIIKLTRDHIIPIAKGGSDNIENIQPLCMPCNSKKSMTSIRY